MRPTGDIPAKRRRRREEVADATGAAQDARRGARASGGACFRNGTSSARSRAQSVRRTSKRWATRTTLIRTARTGRCRRGVTTPRWPCLPTPPQHLPRIASVVKAQIDLANDAARLHHSQLPTRKHTYCKPCCSGAGCVSLIDYTARESGKWQ